MPTTDTGPPIRLALQVFVHSRQEFEFARTKYISQQAGAGRGGKEGAAGIAVMLGAGLCWLAAGQQGAGSTAREQRVSCSPVPRGLPQSFPARHAITVGTRDGDPSALGLQVLPASQCMETTTRLLLDPRTGQVGAGRPWAECPAQPARPSPSQQRAQRSLAHEDLWP